MPTTVSTTFDERYYRHAGSLGLARRISAHARKNIHNLFMRRMAPSSIDRILDIGTSDDTGVESNMLEQLYPYREHLTCASLTDGKAILKSYAGVNHVRIEPGKPLPFADNAFDIVYSNAVLEHAGSLESQRRFVHEMCRVARRQFLAIPNPLFPIEHHTCLPLIHYLPKPWFRAALFRTRFSVWSAEESLNYVSASDLRTIWPDGTTPDIIFSGIGIGCFMSNIVACTPQPSIQNSRP